MRNPIIYPELRAMLEDAGLPIASEDACAIFIRWLSIHLEHQAQYGQLPSTLPPRRNALLVQAIKQFAAAKSLVDVEGEAVVQSLVAASKGEDHIAIAGHIKDHERIQGLHEALKLCTEYLNHDAASDVDGTWHDLAKYLLTWIDNLCALAEVTEQHDIKPPTPGSIADDDPRLIFVTAMLARLGEWANRSEPLSEHSVKKALHGLRGRNSAMVSMR